MIPPSMEPDFPIRFPESLPSRLEKCPIVEAIMEVRFLATEQWRNLPGLLFAKIRDRYPQQTDLPLAQVPEQLRQQQPNLSTQPLMQFSNAQFTINFGPRVVGLVTKTNSYPGWDLFSKEMAWLIGCLKETAFIQEGERLGVRYINFFEEDLLSNLVLETQVAGKPLLGSEMLLSFGLRKEPFVVRLQVIKGAIGNFEKVPKLGNVLDVEVWLGSNDFDLFDNGMDRFSEGHTLAKQIFFGLLKDDFVTKLKPTYS